MQHDADTSSSGATPPAVPPPVPPAPPPSIAPPAMAAPAMAPVPPRAASPGPGPRDQSCWAGAASLLVVCFLLLGILLNWGLHNRRARHDLHAQYQSIADDYALLRARHGELGELMANPQVQWTQIQPMSNRRFGAAVGWHPSWRNGALFIGEAEMLADGEQYQVWIEPDGREAVSAAVFDAPRGAAVHLIRPAQPTNGIRRLFITVEPAGGNARPSGQEIASADLS